MTLLTLQIAKRLRSQATVVVCGSGGSRWTRADRHDELDYVTVPTGPDLLVHRVVQRLRRSREHDPRRPFFESSLFYLPYIMRVAFQLRRRRCDLIHIQSFSHFAPIVRAFNPRARVVLHMHCEWLSQLDATMIGRRLQKVDLVVGCSEHVTERVRQAFPRWAHRCVTVHNGVAQPPPSTSVPAATGRGQRLLFVSRVSPEKGVHVLLEAFRLVASVDAGTVLDIVGPEQSIPANYIVDLHTDPGVRQLQRFYLGAGYGAALRRLIPPELEARVRFVGSVPFGDLASYYEGSRILVLPSLSESFGMPLVEAMAAGLPVVASRVGGIPEVVDDGETGVLVEPNDAPTLARAILALLGDEELAAKMGRQGALVVADRFSWDRAAQEMWRHYLSLLTA